MMIQQQAFSCTWIFNYLSFNGDSVMKCTLWRRNLLFTLLWVASIFVMSPASVSFADTYALPVSVLDPQQPVPVGAVESKPVSALLASVPLTGEVKSSSVSLLSPASLQPNSSYSSLPVSVSTQPENLADADLLGSWHMDGDWRDASGNNLNGAPYGGVGFNTDKKLGTNSGSFNGSDGYVAIGNLYGKFPNNTFTIEAWVKFNDTGNAARRVVAGGVGAYGDYGIGLNNNQIMVYTGNMNNSLYYNLSGVVPTLGVWYHVIGTYDGSQSKIYVNGILKNTLTAPWVQASSNADFWLAGEFCCTNSRVNGLIDEVSVYRRTLSAEEAAFHYAMAVADPNAPAPPVVNAVSPVVGSSSISLSGTKTSATSVWVNNKKLVASDALTTWDASFTTLQPGPNILNIVVLDNNNRSSQPSSVNVFYDNVAPVIVSSSPVNSSNTAKSVTAITVTLSDANAGVDTIGSLQNAVVKNAAGQVVNGIWSPSGSNTILFTPSSGIPLPSDTFTVSVFPVDNVGNRSVLPQQVVFTTHDTGAPTSLATLTGTKGGDGWYSTPVTVTLSATDGSNGSGVAKIEYSLDNVTWQTYTTPLVLDQDGAGYIYFRSTDLAGNVESPAKSQEVKINKAGVIGMWHMDNDWKDASVVANNGTAFNGATFNANAKVGTYSGSFAGSNGYVSIPNSPPLNPPNDITVVGWLKVNAFDKQWQSVFWKGDGPECTTNCENRQYTFWLNSTGYFSLASTPKDRIGVGQLSVDTPAGTVSAGKWTHFAAVVSTSTNSMKIYIDGKQMANSTYSSVGIKSTSGALYLGNSINLNAGFNGQIDEVSIYNRTLSDAEIQGLFRDFVVSQPTVNQVTSPTSNAVVALSGTKPANTGIVINGSAVVPLDSATTWAANYTLTLGNNTLNITALDDQGFNSIPVTTVVALDRVAPQVGSTTPGNNIVVKNSPETLVINLVDAYSGIDFINTTKNAVVSGPNGSVDGTWTSAGTGTSGSVTFRPSAPFTEGSYTATITPTDLLGNSASSSITFSIDQTGPVAPSISTISGPVKASIKTFTGTKSTDSTSVQVTCTGATVGAVTYPTGTTWSVEISGLVSSEHTITAYAFDAVGNSSLPASMTFTVDTTPIRAVYYDARYPLAWMSRVQASTIKTFLVQNGFTELDANTLKTFMQNNDVASTVVMAGDVAPDTVFDTVSSNAIIRKYLNAGGTVLWMGDVPFFYQSHSNGTSSQIGSSGPSTILGTSPGTWDVNDLVTITADGGAFGLSQTWRSPRPVVASSVTKTYASSSGGASAWLKNFNSTYPSTGFVCLWDTGNNLTSKPYLDDLVKVTGITGVVAYPAPVVNGTTPANNFASNNTSVDITFDVSDPYSTIDYVATINSATVKNVAGDVFSGAWSNSGTSNAGTITFHPSAPLPEGKYQVVLTPTDIAGYTSTFALNFSIDTTVPVAPTIDPIPSPNKATTRTITGTKSSDTASVVVSCSDAVVGTVSYPSSTTWSVTISGLKDGNNTITVTAADGAGNNTVSSPVSFVVDTVAPDAPSVDAVTTLTKAPYQVLTGRKPADTALVINNVVRVPMNGSTTWSYSYPLAEGQNTLTIVTRDAAGNDSQPIAPAPIVTLDTTPPLFTVDSYKTPAATVTQTISGKKDPGSVVTMNGTTIITAADTSTTWSYEITLPGGISSHLVFVASDALGNQTTKAIDILCDTVPPSPLAQGALVADNSGKGNEINLSWDAYQEPSDLAYYRVYQATSDFSALTGLTAVATVNKAGTGPKRYKATGLTPATRYYFAVIPVSVSGNVPASFHTVSDIPADTMPPEEVTGVVASAGYSDTDGNTVTLTWNASANSTGDLADQIVYLDAGQGYDGGTAVGKTARSFTRTGLNDATFYKFKITTKDAQSRESAGAVVSAVTRLANPSDLTATPGNGKVILSWKAVNSPYVKQYNVYRLASSATQTGISGMTLIKSQTGTSFSDTGLVNGAAYQYAVNTVNISGASRGDAQSVAGLPRSDTTGPIFSGVTISANQVITAPISITAAATDAESAVGKIEMYLDGVQVGSKNGATISYAWNVVASTDGNHTIKIVAYDEPGNSTEQIIPVVVSLAPPAAPTITSSFPGPINVKVATISGTSQPGATVSLRVNGVVVAQQITDGSSFTFSGVSLLEGDNLIAAKAGNRGGESVFGADLKVSVITSLPSAPVGMAGKALAGGSVQFSWQAGTTGSASGYNLYEVPASFTALTDPGVRKTNSSLIPYLLKEYLPADDGQRNYVVTAVDGAGNEGPASNVVSIASDRLAPSVTHVSFSDTDGVTPSDNVFGPGTLTVTVTVSEVLSEVPFFSLEPQGASPVVVALRKLDDTHYSGTIGVDAASPHGATIWKFSGKDAVANRGNGQGTGPTFDVRGPAATIVAPVTLLKTTAGSAAVSLWFDEPSLAAPVLRLKSVVDGVVAQVTGLATTDGGIHWSGTVDPSSLGEGAGQFEIGGAKDRFGNIGTTVKAGGNILLFKNSPPASTVPGGLTARSAKGGGVALTWTKVADAQGYNLYRKGPGASEPVLLTSIPVGTTVTYTDTPEADGAYGYSISSLGLLGVESDQSAVVVAASDRIPPAVPVGLTLSMTGNGVRATWDAVTAPAEIPASFRVYRAQAPFADLAGLSPVVTATVNSAVDSAPISGQRYYAVTALDALGNESAPTPAQEIIFPVAPVANLVLSRVDNGAPSLSWSSGEANLKGFNLYRNGKKINQTPTSSTTYLDGYYGGGTLTYGVSAVDANDTESAIKEVSLPALDLSLKDGTAMHRGVLENLTLVTTLAADAASGLAIDAVSVKLGTLPESTLNGPFTAAPGVPLEIGKVAATEATAPPQEALLVSATIRPAPGTTVKIVRSSVATVLGAGTALEIFNDPLVRGTTANVRLKVNNLGSAGAEFLTSENGGPTAHATVYLKDEDGNILAQGSLNQQTGSTVKNYGSYSKAQIEPGGSFLSAPIPLAIPASAPYKVSLSAVIDNTYYGYGQDDQVVAPGLTQSVAATLADVSYLAEATTDKSSYRQGEAVLISGWAKSTASGSPMPLVPVKLGISVKGFDRYYTVSSDSTGRFTFRFTPGANEAGSYSVWAAHPDLAGRSIQAQFSIIGLSISPTAAEVTILKGQSLDIPVTLTNLGGTALPGLSIETSSSNGISASAVDVGSDTLAAGEKRTVKLHLASDAGAPDSAVASLNVATGGLTGVLDANISLVTPLPLIGTSPSYLDTGLVRGTQRIVTFTVKNVGYGTLKNAHLEGLSLPWLSLAVEKNLGDLPAGESRTVAIRMSPTESTGQAVYNDRLVLYSDNHIPYSYNIQVTVTSSSVGSVNFNVLDELNHLVGGASITVQNQDVPELIYTVTTSENGSASLTDIPEGRYSYNISASKHKSYGGSFVATPGIMTTVPIALEVNLVQVEWSVTPTTIQDKYEVTINQIFETNVPTPVIVAEPPGLTLPEMAPGEVFNGEFKVTNYGLISLDNVNVQFPTSFGDYDIELQATLPPSLAAMQRVSVPYRVTRRRSQTAASGASGAVACLASEIAGFGGSSCFANFTISTYGTAQICPSSPRTVYKTADYTVSVPAPCAGSGTAGGSNQVFVPPPPVTYNTSSTLPPQTGGGWAPGAIPSLIDSAKSDCGCEIPKCTGPNCAKVCTNSLVDFNAGTYEDTHVDLDIRNNGLPVRFERNYASRWTSIGVVPELGVSNSGTKTKYATSTVVGGDGVSAKQQAFGWTSPWFAKMKIASRVAGYLEGNGAPLGTTWMGIGDWLSALTAQTATYFDGAGHVIYFLGDGKGSFWPAPGAESFVAEQGIRVGAIPGAYQVVDKSGLRRNFGLLNDAGWFLLTSLEDTHGNVLVFEYDQNRNLEKVTDRHGAPLATFSYENGFIKKLTDRDGREVSYAVDSLGRLTEATGPVGEKSTFSYDQVSNFNRLRQKTDPEGHVTSIDYRDGELVVSKVTEPGGGVRTFDYDFKGYTFYNTDTRGNVSVYKVNTNGKLVSVTTNGQLVKSVEYKTGRTEVITDGSGTSTTVVRNEAGDPTRVTDGNGNTTSISYNEFWKVAQITDSLGKITKFNYNNQADIIDVTDALGTKTSFEYDGAGNVLKIIKGEGAEAAITRYEYDGRGNPVKVTDPTGQATLLSYDRYGHLNGVTDPNNNTSKLENDLLGQPLSIQNPLGEKKKFAYDKKGNLTSVIDELNHATSFSYDFKGRLTSSTDHLGRKTSLVRDGEGNVVEKHEVSGTPQEVVTKYDYDILNRLKSVTDPMGSVTRYDYAGSPGCASCGGGSGIIPATVTDPFGKVTRNQFDKAGKVVGVTDPLSNLTNIVRDEAGRPSSVLDANGNSNGYAYDELGRVSQQVDANGGLTDFAYDIHGNLETLSDPKGNETRFEYDLAGRKTKEIRPMGQTTEYGYYPNGLLETVKDAKGQVTTYGYDAANRLTGVLYADGRQDSFGYDSAGNLTSYTNDAVSGTIAYDELNRKISEKVNYGGFSKTFTYSYDASGNKQSFTTAEGTIYSYGYDKNHQPTSISFSGKQISFDYDRGRLNRTTFPKGLFTDFGYNDASWLSYITTRNASGTLADSQYGFDKVGNITSKSTDHGSGSYGYDATYQLTSATHPALPQESFNYDQVGNRTSSSGEGSASYAHNANNEMVSAESLTFGYDANGNLVTRTDAGGTTSYLYSSFDRLEQVQLPNGSVAVYGYDPFGRRVKKEVAGKVTYYLYSDEGLVGEYDQTGTLKKEYGWKPYGIWGTDPVLMREGGSYYYYRNDHLGTPQQLIDESGKVVWSAEYTAFGKAVVDPASTVDNNLRFPGQYFDEETGLHYNWQRYYDPYAGRYIADDPLGVGGGDANLYRYTSNNPANDFDPFGLYDAGDFAYDASNFLIGIGDTVSLGLTAKLRQKLGTDDAVNKCSTSYKAGEVAGTLIDLYVGGVAFKGGAKLLGRFRGILGNEIGAIGDIKYLKLTQTESSAMTKIDNAIKGHLKEGDFTGTIRDMLGNPVPKPNGGYWDHLLEMNNTLRGLRNNAAKLENSINPAAQAARERAITAIKSIEDAIKGIGL